MRELVGVGQEGVGAPPCCAPSSGLMEAVLPPSNWDVGEPNNQKPSEDCVVMGASGKWNDVNCRGWLDSWVCDRLVAC